MRNKTTEDFMTSARNTHGSKYDYSNSVYKKAIVKVQIICPIHGLFLQTPQKHIQGNGCPLCGSDRTKTPLFGVGINDLRGYQNTVLYNTWRKMLERCYSEKYRLKKPTYKECSVCTEWHRLSNFKIWFVDNYKEGYHLDKDILGKNSKIYSPNTCSFIPPEINTLLLNNASRRGAYPVGVSFDKKRKRYVAQINSFGNNKKIGYFEDTGTAFLAYKKEKESYVKYVAKEYYLQGKIDWKVYSALTNYKILEE